MSAVSRTAHSRVEPCSFRLATLAVPHMNSQLYSIPCPARRSRPFKPFFLLDEHESYRKHKSVNAFSHGALNFVSISGVRTA